MSKGWGGGCPELGNSCGLRGCLTKRPRIQGCYQVLRPQQPSCDSHQGRAELLPCLRVICDSPCLRAQVRIPDPQLLLSHKCLLQLPVLSAHTAQQGYKPHLTLKEKNAAGTGQTCGKSGSYAGDLPVPQAGVRVRPMWAGADSQGLHSAHPGTLLPSEVTGQRLGKAPPGEVSALSPHLPDKQGPPPCREVAGPPASCAQHPFSLPDGSGRDLPLSDWCSLPEAPALTVKVLPGVETLREGKVEENKHLYPAPSQGCPEVILGSRDEETG